MPAPASERLAAARAGVDRVCQLLLSPTPQQLDQCAQLLRAVIVEMPPAGDGNSAATREQARLLKTSIGRAARLLEGAAAYHANWIRWLGARCSGYNGQGEPGTVERGGHLLARG